MSNNKIDLEITVSRDKSYWVFFFINEIRGKMRRFMIFVYSEIK